MQIHMVLAIAAFNPAIALRPTLASPATIMMPAIGGRRLSSVKPPILCAAMTSEPEPRGGLIALAGSNGWRVISATLLILLIHGTFSALPLLLGTRHTPAGRQLITFHVHRACGWPEVLARLKRLCHAPSDSVVSFPSSPPPWPWSPVSRLCHQRIRCSSAAVLCRVVRRSL